MMSLHHSATSSSSLSSAMTMAALTSIALKPYRSAAGRSLDNLSMSRIGAWAGLPWAHWYGAWHLDSCPRRVLHLARERASPNLTAAENELQFCYCGSKEFFNGYATMLQSFPITEFQTCATGVKSSLDHRGLFFQMCISTHFCMPESSVRSLWSWAESPLPSLCP